MVLKYAKYKHTQLQLSHKQKHFEAQTTTVNDNKCTYSKKRIEKKILLHCFDTNTNEIMSGGQCN